MRFVDTNLLLYRASTVKEEKAKREIVTALLRAEDLVLSVQVLQEFYVQATRPTRSDPLFSSEALAFIRSWKRFPVITNTVDILEAAVAASERWQLSYWDAAIVEAARAGGCHTLLSEDLNTGQDFDGVLVVNPLS